MSKIVGILLSAIGMAALFRFDLIQNQFSFLSPDGNIGAYSLFQLKACLGSLLVCGLVLTFKSVALRLAASTVQWLASLSNTRLLATLLGAGLVLRVLAVIFFPLHIWSDCMEYDRLAVNWLKMDGYYDGAYPTAYWPPAYPFVLSKIYLVFGHVPKAGACLNIFLNLGICFLTYKIAAVVWSEKVGRVTLLLMVFFPGQILFTNPLLSENLFTLLLLGALFLLMNTHEPDRSHWLSVLIGGIILGVATLTRAVSLAFLPLLIPFWILQTGKVSVSLRNFVLAACGLMLIVTPWLMRNSEIMGKATISTNGGVNFYIGNSPSSGMGWIPPDPDVFILHDARYEIRNDSVGYARGIEYIRSHPIGFLKRGVMKMAYLFASDFDAIAPDVIESLEQKSGSRAIILAYGAEMYYLLVLLFAAFGVEAWFRDRSLGWPPGSYLVLATIAYWCAVHFVFFGCGRFHFPIIPMIASLGAMGICHLADSHNRGLRTCSID